MHCIEICLAKRSLTYTSNSDRYSKLSMRSLTEPLPAELFQGSCTWISEEDLAKRSVIEILSRGSCQETSSRDLCTDLATKYLT